MRIKPERTASLEADDPDASWSAPLVALLIQAAGTPVQIRTISVTGYQGKCRPGKVRVYLEASANARIYALERTGPCRERLLLDLLLDTWLTRKERSVVHPAFIDAAITGSRHPWFLENEMRKQ